MGGSCMFEVVASEGQRWHFIHCFNVLQNIGRKKWLIDDGMTEIISEFQQAFSISVIEQ